MERRGKGRGIFHVCDDDLAALRGPGLAFLDIANNSANVFVGKEQRAGHRSADSSGYSGDGVHLCLLVDPSEPSDGEPAFPRTANLSRSLSVVLLRHAELV